VLEFIVKVPVPVVTGPDVNNGVNDEADPESLFPALPITVVFCMVVVKSVTATGKLPTNMVIVDVLHTIGLTVRLQMVYVVVADPVNKALGVNVYCPVLGLTVSVPVLAEG
jgi:hypothetical protein